MATVAELVFGIVYGAPDKGPLDKAIKDAQDAAGKASAPWVSAGKTVVAGVAAAGAAAIAAGAGLFALTDRATKAGDEIAKGARRAGVSTTEYQRFAHAASLADVETGLLTRGIQDLNKNLAAVDDGGGKAFLDSIGSIGVSVEQLRGSSEENLGVLFDALNAIEDPSLRSAKSIEIFGKAGRQMSSLIEGGAAGLSAAGDEIERIGILSEEQTQQSEAFQDALTRGEAVVSSFANEIGVAAAPALQGLIDDTSAYIAENDELIRQDAAGAFEAMADAAVALLPVIEVIAPVVAGIAHAIQGIGIAVDGMRIAIRNFVDDPSFRTFVELTPPGFLGDSDALGEAAANAADRDQERVNARAEAAQNREALRVTRENASDARKLLAESRVRRDETGAVTHRWVNGRWRAVGGAGRGGRGRGRGRSVDFEAEDFELLEAEEEFGAQIDVLAGSVNATPVQRQAALEAASAARARGASPNVAVKAAQSTLESLTGGKARTSDPTLSSLLGTNVPDVELSTLARGAEPQVLVSNIYNTFTFSNDFDIDGAGDPVAVAERTVDVMRTTWQDQINQATKTVKVDFAR